MRKGVQKRKIVAYVMALTLVVTSVLTMSNVKAESEETSVTETLTTTEEESEVVSEVISGQCGENAYFEYGKDKVLRITGEGEIDTKTYMDLNDAGINDEVVRIAMESGITSVAAEAFMDYTALETVDFSWKVTSIGEKAFANCTSLKAAIIPKKTSYIGNYAFQNCASIETVYILANESIVEEYAFDGCDSIKTLLSLVDDIAAYNSAFPSTWPESLETIYSLTSDCAADYAYKNNITHVEPTSTNYTGDNATYRNYVSFKDGLRVVYGGGVVDPVSGYNTGSDVAKKIVIVYGMTAIEPEAYSGYSVLESVYIPESVTSIGYRAFNGCSSLKEVTLPESLTTIESGLFNGCSSLADIKIPDNVTSIGSSAFKGCKSLTEIKIPDNVTSIGSSAFSGCTNITTMKIRNPEVTLTSSRMPENLETIYGYVGSTAETYASENGINFIALDGEVETTPNETESTTVTETTTPETTTEPKTELETTTVSETTTKSSDYITTTNPETTTKSSDYITTTDPETTTKSSEDETTTNNEIKTTTIPNNSDVKLIGKSKIKKLKEKSHRSVKITWKKASGAITYAVYRSNKKNGKYKLIKTTNKLNYTDKKVKAGKKYYYKIKAINASGVSTMSKAKKIKVKGTPKTPKIKVSKNSTSWSIVWGTITDNSKGIEIYMKNGQGKYKKFTRINKTTNLKKSKKKKGVTGITSSISTLQSGVTYKFKARTYAVVKGKKVYSKWSKVKTLKK